MGLPHQPEIQMRLVDALEPEDYQPLERGSAFTQYYENGDKCCWYNNMDWHHKFWLYGTWEMPAGHNRFDEAWLMGGEL